jgi:restriction endonuclease S subunit
MIYSKNIRYSVTGQAFKAIYTPVPPINTQKEIALFLDNKTNKIDQLINNQQQQIEKLKEYKQSLISEVVTKGLDLNVEFKDSSVDWIGKIPKNWDIIRIKDYSINTTRRNEDEALNYIALENIVSESFQYIETENVYDPKEGIFAPKHSVLFGKLRPYLAKSFYCKEDVSCSSEFAVFPFNDEVTSKYFLLLTQTFGFIETINMSTYGTKMPRANINFINNLSAPLPTFDEQLKILNFLIDKISKIDALIRIKEKKIDELSNYKKSLIYEYVTGKKEIS